MRPKISALIAQIDRRSSLPGRGRIMGLFTFIGKLLLLLLLARRAVDNATCHIYVRCVCGRRCVTKALETGLCQQNPRPFCLVAVLEPLRAVTIALFLLLKKCVGELYARTPLEPTHPSNSRPCSFLEKCLAPKRRHESLSTH